MIRTVAPADQPPQAAKILAMDATDGAVVAGGSRWSRGDAYERYLGRWSAMLAPRFVDWLGSDRGAAWVDVGCGSGALTAAVLAADETPGARVCGVDPSAGFLGTARRRIGDRRVHFTVADAARLPFDAACSDLAVSGLVLNFLDDPVACLREMARVCRSGGTVGGYVWDYTGQMWLLRHFWEAVFALRPDARDLDEVRRFAACQPDPLRALFTAAGLAQVEVTAIDDVATFRDFDDYWDPFLSGQGAAPSFVVSLPEEARTAIAQALRDRLPTAGDGTISVGLRVWAVRGVVPA